MEENDNINTNTNNNNLSQDLMYNNNEILTDLKNLEELDDEEEQNDALIQDLIKQGKYFDVIKFLESKDKNGKNKMNLNNENGVLNNNDNNEEEEELKIIPADDISDLHEDNNNINEDKEDDEKNKNDD